MTTSAQLSAQVTEVLTRWNQQQDQLAAWLTGDPSGGPNGDGTYPLTDAEGNTENFLCLPGILDQVSGPAASASNAQTAAEAAQVLAEAAKAAADVAAAAAAADRTQVSQLKTDVITQRDDVAAKWSDVNFWHGQVSASQIAIAAAETATLTYRDETLTARDDTLVARNEAQMARDEAEGFAASINPAALVTTTALQAELDALVGAAPGTLDTLNEIAAALGDDPNFATTVTTSLAGKSDIGHGHVIADVSGLQTALDGKQPVGSYSVTGHGHSISDVTGLQTALDGKLSLTGGVISGGLDVHGKARFVADGHTGGGFHLSRNTAWENSDDDVYFQVFDDGLYVTIDNDIDGDSGTFTVRYITSGTPTELLWATPTAFRYKSQNIFHDGYHPNADKLTTARTISLAGDVTGSTSFDGSGNVTITATVADDSHNHTYDNIDGLTTNGWGGPRITTGNGYIDFGPANTNYAHIYTDRPAFYFNKDLQVNGQQVFHNAHHPNADKLTTARTISLGGDMSGSAAFDGSSNVTITATLDNNMTPSRAEYLSNTIDPDNLLSINDAGFYYQAANVSTVGKGYPISQAGSLLVQKSAGVTQLYQTYNTDSARMFYRSNYAGTWGAWQGLFSDNYHPNADKLTTARSISLTGDVTGTLSFDGSANVSMTTTASGKYDKTGGTLTGNVMISRAAPIFTLYESDGATHEKNWSFVADGNNLTLRLYDDTFSPYTSAFTITRNGNQLDTFTIGGNQTLNGNLTVAETLRLGFGESDTTDSASQVLHLGDGGLGASRIRWDSGGSYGQMGTDSGGNLVCFGSKSTPLYIDNPVGGIRVRESATYTDTLAASTTELKYKGGGVLRHNTSARGSGNITVSTAAPSGGSNGDIWLQV